MMPYFLQPPKHSLGPAMVSAGKGYISAEEFARFSGPVVQIIDDWFTNRKLGYAFEARIGPGKLIACAFDLTADLEKRPAARQLLASLRSYANSAFMLPAGRYINQPQRIPFQG